MSSPLHAVTVGRGPRIIFVHGSAADHATWTIQLASAALRERFELVAYDRRGTGNDAEARRSVEAHADDLALLIEGGASSLVPAAGPVLAVGSSFGAVVVLECARRRPELLRGVVLCEPPLPPSDQAPPVPPGFHDRLDDAAARGGFEAGAELFLRTVLGDAAYDRMPRAFQARSQAQWPQIRGDSGALEAYRIRYAELGSIMVPALLLGGDRSAPYFRVTLDALAAHLGRARLEILGGAGHMMHAEAHRSFHEKLIRFADSLG